MKLSIFSAFRSYLLLASSFTRPYRRFLIRSAGIDFQGCFPSCTALGSAAVLLLACLSTNCLAQILDAGHALYFDGSTNASLITSPFQGFPSTDITVEFWARSTDTTKPSG